MWPLSTSCCLGSAFTFTHIRPTTQPLPLPLWSKPIFISDQNHCSGSLPAPTLAPCHSEPRRQVHPFQMGGLVRAPSIGPVIPTPPSAKSQGLGWLYCPTNPTPLGSSHSVFSCFPLAHSAVATQTFWFSLEHIRRASNSGRPYSLFLHLLGTFSSQIHSAFTLVLPPSLPSKVPS